MSGLVIDSPQTVLTEEDLVTIIKIAQATSGEKRNPIFTIRGPETAEAFAVAFPEKASQIRRDFSRLQKLGSRRMVGTLTETTNANPGVRYFKHIDRWFVGSKNFPKGIPVGMYESETQAVAGVSNQWNHTGSRAEVDDEERNRLEALAEGKRFLTKWEIEADEIRKNASRNARVETDLNPVESTAKAIGAALGPAMAQALPALLVEMRKQGYIVTPPKDAPR